MSINSIFRTPSAYEFPLLIKHLWITPLANAPDEEIVYRGERRQTYAQTWERVGRLASMLKALGARPGKTVAVLDWDSHRYLECFFAIPMMGCVLQTVNVRLSADQILYTLNHAGAEIVLAHADFLPLLAAVRDRLETVKNLILIHDGMAQADAPLALAGEYEGLLADADPEHVFPDLDENSRATTFYTTGTTGLPKGVYFSHRQIVLHALALMSWLGTAPAQGRLHREDVYMPMTPMFHVHAWGLPFVATLMGVKQVYPGRYAPGALLKLIRDEDVTFSHCVPTVLQMLLSHPASKDLDMSRLKVMVGGSALPAGLARAALERNMDVFCGYGMSETGPVQVLNHLSSDELRASRDEQATLRTRTGRAIALCEVSTRDENSQPVPRDGRSRGEVVFRSPWLTQGYLHDPERSEELWRGGMLHSGDIGCLTADGRLQISDRVKDVIKSGGEWVSSLDLENILSELPGVAEAAVIAVADPQWGERPLALIVPQPRSHLDVAAIRAHLSACAARGAISKYGVPDRVMIVDKLDRTSVGKLDKKTLRAKYAGTS